jgi:dihydrofolate synthase/folylpolyglutamate synthase
MIQPPRQAPPATPPLEGNFLFPTLQDCEAQLSTYQNNPADLNRFATLLNKARPTLKKKPFIITITGTNGKGTTTHLLESILLQAGCRVGMYTSPHLQHITERYRINGKNISEAEWIHYFNESFHYYAEKNPNWFEYLSFIGLLFFYDTPLDVLLLEIGIGGKHDIINAIDPDLSIITTIALDHTEKLGNTREAIGAEKAGILRAHQPAICGDAHPPHNVIDYAHKIEATLYIQGKDFHYTVTNLHFNFSNTRWNFNTLPLPHIPAQNVATAIEALSHTPFTFDESTIAKGIEACVVPGRYQTLQTNPLVIVDVAHNPEACRYLAENLQRDPVLGNTFAIVGMAGRKDIEASLAPLLPLVAQWAIVDIISNEPCVERMVAMIPNATIYFSVKAALAALQKCMTANDRLIVFGSFITVSQAIEAFA